ncbi:MAG: aldo/keto reductase, partial [Desulfobacterales bacterium]
MKYMVVEPFKPEGLIYIDSWLTEDGMKCFQLMEAQAHRVLDSAWDAGIRYFDAARSYGKAEDFLHSWLAKRGI